MEEKPKKAAGFHLEREKGEGPPSSKKEENPSFVRKRRKGNLPLLDS